MEKPLGIVFAGGEGPEPEKLRRLLGGPAGGAITVAADSGLLLAEAAGIRPDWVVGDMDSLQDAARLDAYPPQRVMRHPADKDHTDTELALGLLWEKGCDEVWIVGGGGGRTAHLFAIRDIFERERFPARWLTAGEDIRCLDPAPSVDGSLVLNGEAGGLLSVFPLGGGPWLAESRGLRWPLDGVCWERGLYGLSNVTLGGKATLRAVRGRFMVILEGTCRRL